MIEYYFLLILLSIPILAFFVFVAQQRQLRKYLFIAIPLVLAVVFKLWYAIESIKSLPSEKLPAEYILIDGVEIPMKAIYLWVAVKGTEYPVTVKLPWSPNSSKALAQAKKGMEEGKRYSNVEMSEGKQPRGPKNSTNDEQGELKFYEFQIKDYYKK